MEKNISIGSKLRKAREKKKVSLDDISQKTKININILKALEEDDLTKLPNIAYVKGFVKSYAKAVNVSQEEAIEALNATYQIQDKSEQSSSEPEEAETDTEKTQSTTVTPVTPENNEELDMQESIRSIVQSFFNKKVILIAVVVIVAVVTLKTIVNWFAQLNFERENLVQINQGQEVKDIALKGENENLLEMKSVKKFAQEVQAENKKAQEVKKEEIKKEEPKPEVKEPEVAKVEEKKIEEVKKEEPRPEVKEPEVAKVEEKKIEEVKKEEPKPEVIPDGKFPFKKFKPANKDMYSVIDNSPEENDPSLLPSNIKNAALPDKQNVYIIASEGDTWISYQKDDEKIRRFVLKQGRRVLIKGETILLFMGNYKVAKIFLNNKLLNIGETKSGVKSLIFPSEEAPNYMLPLFPSYKGIPYKASEYMKNMAPKAQTETL